MMNTEDKQYLCGLKRKDFQTTIHGRTTDLFILKNKQGAEIALTNYGGAIVAIMMPDRNGQMANIIQGHDNIDNPICRPSSGDTVIELQKDGSNSTERNITLQ